MRKMSLSVLVVGALALVGFAPAAQARPLTQSTTCDVSAIATFNPGLTLGEKAQTIKMKGTLSSCNGGGVTSGSFRGTGSGTMSCTSGSGTGILKVTWDTTEVSKISITLTTSGLSGTVIGGKFKGEDVTADVTITPLQGNCFPDPVTKAGVSGTVSL